MKITDKYVFFWKDTLAQWNAHEIYDPLSKRWFSHREQYMMFGKAMLFGDLESAEAIMKAKHPREQQAIGRTVKGYKQETWDLNKYEIVFNGNWLHFTSCAEKLNQLLSYDRNLKFVEASPTDKVWGIGMDEDEPGIEDERNWKGQNLLGKAITEVRNRILKQLSFQLSYYEVPVIKG